MGDSSSPQQAGRLLPGQENGGPSVGNSFIYDTAEFHLYCRKIVACSKRYSHEWTTCPFAHPGEKAKRRDPRTHQYDCEMCPTVAKGEVCELGAACPHSHHVFESWLHPQKFRTMICKDGEACHREICFFAHGAEQLRAPTGGPSKLRRQSCSQDEAARQAGAAAAAAAAAAVFAGSSSGFGGVQNPQAAAASAAAAAAAQFNALAGNVGASGSSSRHVWFQGLQQQQQGSVVVMPFVEAGASAGSNMGKRKPMGSVSGTSAATSGSLYLTALSSSSNAVQANDDSSSWCESGTSSMMAGPGASGMQLSGNSAYSGSVRNSLELGRPPIARGMSAAAAGGNTAGLANMSSMQMLVSSLVAEIQNSCQEAVDSHNAAVQAQQQLKAITEALSAAAGGSGGPGDAAAQAGQLLGGSTAAAARDQQQRVMMQRAGSGMPAFTDAGTVSAAAAAAAAGLQLAGPGLAHTISDGSNKSCSPAGNWAAAAAAAAGMMAGLSSANIAASTTAPDTAITSLEQAVAQRLSLEQAVAAAGGAPGGSSKYGMLPGTADGQLHGYAVPSSYPIAAGNAGCFDGVDGGAVCGAGVMNWLQLLPPAQGLDTAVPIGDFSTASAGVGGDMAASAAAGVATAGSWRNSFEAGAPVFGLAPAAAAAAVSQGLMMGTGKAPVTVALPVGGNVMQHPQQQQQQQQLTSDYLLRLQQQHALLSAPELAFASGRSLQDNTQQQQLQAMWQQQAMQQQQGIRSAPVMLQGWQGAGKVACAEDCINNSGTLEGLVGPSVEMPGGYTATGGNRHLGWL